MVLVRLDPVEGHEQAGRRPALVVSYEPFHNAGLATVVPIISARAQPRLPGDVAMPAGEGGLGKRGVIVCSQIRTLSMLRIVIPRTSQGRARYITSPALRGQVRDAIGHHLGLDVPPEADGAT